MECLVHNFILWLCNFTQEGEAPLLLVGLIDGQLVLVEVLRASLNLALEIQTTVLEHLLKGKKRPCRCNPVISV